MISIIVPVYKAEKYLRRCIDSILVQTYTDFELLLIDDGSPDSSGEICDEYAKQDSRVRVFHKPNGGVSSARNLGLDNAKGEWITFVDADDWVERYYIETLTSPNDADMILCSVKASDGFIWKTGDAIYSLKEFINGFNDNLLIRSSWATSFRNSIIQDKKIRYDERMRYGEDMIFNLCYLSYCSKIKTNSYLGYVYFQDGNAHPQKYGLTFDEIFYALNKAIHKKEEISRLTGCDFNLGADFASYLSMCPVVNMVDEEYLEGYFQLCKRFSPTLNTYDFYNHPLYSPVIRCISELKNMYEQRNYTRASELSVALYSIVSRVNINNYAFPYKDFYLWYYLIKMKKTTLLDVLLKLYFFFKKVKKC